MKRRWPTAQWLRDLTFVDEAENNETTIPIHVMTRGTRVNGTDSGPIIMGPIKVTGGRDEPTTVHFEVLADDVEWADAPGRGNRKHPARLRVHPSGEWLRIMTPVPGEHGENTWVTTPGAREGVMASHSRWPMKVPETGTVSAHLFVASVAFVGHVPKEEAP